MSARMRELRTKIIRGTVIVLVLAAGWFIWTGDNELSGWIRHYVFRAEGAAMSLGRTGGSKDPNNARICRENLSRIQTAKRKAGQDRGNSIGAVTWEEVVRAMYPNDPHLRGNTARVNELMPKCPEGGSYTLGTMEELPKCSVAGNNTTPKEDDHIIYQ